MPSLMSPPSPPPRGAGRAAEGRSAGPPRRSRTAGSALVLLLALLLAGIGLGGCQHVVHPPEEVSDPVSVYVVDYGRHASLAIPAEDAGLLEWSWGDWNWFALERTGVIDGLRAIFASPRSTLSRRELASARDAGELAERLGATEVLSLEVERERARALREELEARWQQGRDEAVRHPGGRVFVPDDARYSLFNNSVHAIVRWLEALGAEVTGRGVTANFKLGEPRPAAPPPG